MEYQKMTKNKYDLFCALLVIAGLLNGKAAPATTSLKGDES